LTARRAPVVVIGLFALTVGLVAGAVALTAVGNDTTVPHRALRPGPAHHLLGNKPPVPTHGSYIGAWVRPNPVRHQTRAEAVHDVEEFLGRRFDIVHTYRTWSQRFPITSDHSVTKAGSFLLLSEAWPDARLLASGAEDDAIAALGRAIRQFRAPIFFEPRWEMDRPNLAGVVHSPRTFIAAWMRMHAIFDRVGVRNAAWVWCPTAAGFADGDAPAYFPGDDVVDWICVDAYPTHAEESLAALIRPFLRWAEAHPQPIMIGEFGVPRSQGSHRRAAWLRAAQSTVRHTPRVKAVVYFDSDGEGAIPYFSYGLARDRAAFAAFRHWVRAPYFDIHGLAS